MYDGVLDYLTTLDSPEDICANIILFYDALNGVLDYLTTLDSPEDICANIILFYDALRLSTVNNSDADAYFDPTDNPYITPTGFVSACTHYCCLVISITCACVSQLL